MDTTPWTQDLRGSQTLNFEISKPGGSPDFMTSPQSEMHDSPILSVIGVNRVQAPIAVQIEPWTLHIGSERHSQQITYRDEMCTSRRFASEPKMRRTFDTTCFVRESPSLISWRDVSFPDVRISRFKEEERWNRHLLHAITSVRPLSMCLGWADWLVLTSSTCHCSVLGDINS